MAHEPMFTLADYLIMLWAFCLVGGPGLAFVVCWWWRNR